MKYTVLALLTAAGLALSSGVSHADIFLKGDSNNLGGGSSGGGGSIFLGGRSPSGSKKDSNAPIFVKPNEANNARSVPNYAITNKKAKDQGPVGFGNAAEKLQAQKLKEARNRSAYKDSRQENINLATLPEAVAKYKKGATINDLLDRTAYNSVIEASNREVEQIQQQTEGPSSEETLQRLQAEAVTNANQAAAASTAQLQAQSREFEAEYQRQSKTLGGGDVITSPTQRSYDSQQQF